MRASSENTSGAIAVPKAVVPSYTNADFPACKMWLKCDEESGSSLVDKMGGVTGLTITANGTATPWTTPLAFEAEGAAGNESYALTAYSNAATALNVGTGHLMIELDLTASASTTDGACHIDFGDAFSASRGWQVFMANASGVLGFRCRGTAGADTAAQFTGTTSILSARKHCLIVWDRTLSSLGQIHYFINGVVQSGSPFSLSPAVDPVSVTVASGNLAIGRRNSGPRYANAIYHNIRVWRPAAIPSNLTDIAMDMYISRNEFPQTMLGVA